MLHAARSSRSVRRSLTSFRFPAARQAVPTSARSWISTKSMNQIPPAEHGSTGYMRFSSPSVKISACQSPVPPFPTALIYNQSKHACQSVLADLRAVWGSKIHVIQTVEAGQHALQGVDGVIFIQKKKWGDMEHFGARLDASCTVDPKLSMQRANGDVVFMPGWSAFAESPEAARAVTGLGLVWPGTEPVASEKLEKIGFKKICRQVGAPTPNFCVLADEGPSADLKDPQEKARIVEKYMASIAEMNTSEPGLIKSIHGGGGKGTAHLNDPSDVEQTRAAIEKVLNEMGRSDGVYFEEKVHL